MNKMEALAAGALVTSAAFTALSKLLMSKGLLNVHDLDDIYVNAKFMLKEKEASADAELRPVFAAACSYFDELLGQTH